MLNLIRGFRVSIRSKLYRLELLVLSRSHIGRSSPASGILNLTRRRRFRTALNTGKPFVSLGRRNCGHQGSGRGSTRAITSWRTRRLGRSRPIFNGQLRRPLASIAGNDSLLQCDTGCLGHLLPLLAFRTQDSPHAGCKGPPW